MRRVVVVALPLLLAFAPAAEAKSRSFHTPSKNIYCMYDSNVDGGPWLRCDVLSLNDVGFTLDRRHKGRRIHITDSVVSQRGRELGYGESARYGPFRCTSRRTGLTCRSRPSGHGFRLSRAKQTVF